MHKELEERMLALSAIAKAEAIQILTKTWSDRPSGITKTSGVCGGDDCIGNTPEKSYLQWIKRYLIIDYL